MSSDVDGRPDRPAAVDDADDEPGRADTGRDRTDVDRARNASSDVDPDPAPGTVDVPADSIVASLTTRVGSVHPAAWLTLVGAVTFAVVFGRLGLQNHRNFGTWAFDMGIYDQGFWLVSRGQSWITVRGIDFWGHHFNPIVLAFVPFYWLGAGPGFLYVAQAAVLGAGAIPVYLLARDRLHNPWVGLAFAVVYLLYAPIQWIAWASFHPEALVVTPFLFAWWFATRRRWTGCFVSLVIALSTREDVALAVIVMGVVLWWWLRRQEPADAVNADDPLSGVGAADRADIGAVPADPPGDAPPPDPGRRDRRLALLVSVVGVAWYVVATRLVIPTFNRGLEPFYIEYFYGHYGSTTFEVAQEIVQRPDRVISDATQPDRLRFYRDLLLPWGGLPLGGLAELAMAGPQMLASVIGSSPYARTIRYQYTAVMIAPITIAAIEAAAWMWKYRFIRRYLVPWLLVCAYITNVAWSPSPIGAHSGVWAQEHPRHDAMRDAVAMVPSAASVSATYQLLPHLSHRAQVYNWPNPWIPSYWSNDDSYRLPDPATIEYVVVDRFQVEGDQAEVFEQLIGPSGDYDVLFDRDDVVVARRR